MDEINKVDEVVGLMKNDYDRIRLQTLAKKKEATQASNTMQTRKPLRPPSSARSREPVQSTVAQR